MKRIVTARIHCREGCTTLEIPYLKRILWGRVDLHITPDLDIIVASGNGFNVVRKKKTTPKIRMNSALSAEGLFPEDVAGEYSAVLEKGENGLVSAVKIPRHTRHLTFTTANVRRRGTWLASRGEHEMWKRAASASGLALTPFIRSAVSTYIRDHHQHIWDGAMEKKA